MKILRLCALSFAGLVCILAAAPSGHCVQQAYKCGKDAMGSLNCARVVSTGRSGQSGTYTDSSSGKMCKWQCKSDRGIETCKASGNECGNKLPPHWR